MNILVVGIGGFGSSWLKSILANNSSVKIVALVEKNPDQLKKVMESTEINNSIFFLDINAALASVKPDFILNVTPPNIHKAINYIAFEHRIPVLSEKPIAQSYQDAIDIMEKSRELNVPIMIAENYRYTNMMRTVKKYIMSGELGKLNSIHLDFQRRHRVGNYHKDMEHPLLLDVTIHHIDTLRYLTGVEAKSIVAKAWNQDWSWHAGFSNVDFLMDMEEDISVSYRGCLSSFVNETGWLGKWRIEGEHGIIRILDNKISIKKENEEFEIDVKEPVDSRKYVLEEFINSLKENRIGETDISDNFMTYQIVHAAIESINKNQWIDILQK